MTQHRLPEIVLITGATGAIGGALAAAYARPGVLIILQGRNRQRLDLVARECELAGAQVLSAAFDLRDRAQLRAWAGNIFAAHAVDLVIVNAGVNTNTGAESQGEAWTDVEALLEVNIYAAMALVDAALPSMRARKSGQIALISSLAAYYGLPVTPAYCASKAALKTYGEALRGWLGPEGVRINVVMPGYVDSQMCRAMPGPKPFLWPASKAAKVIAKGLAANRARIAFPFPLNAGTWLLSVLPPAFSGWILGVLGYRG